MTGSRDFKRLVRQRMAETGESYTVARSHFDPPPKKKTKPKGESPRPTVDAFRKNIYERRATNELDTHLEKHYGIDVSRTTELDVGVYRVDRGSEESWVARIFPASRSADAVEGDAEILRFLEDHDFPAERLAHTEPTSVLAGQLVLVTRCAAGSNRRSDVSEETLHALGAMLGRLHALPDGPDACARPAGSWHHLSINGGNRRSDVDLLLALLDDERTRLTHEDQPRFEALREELAALDDLEDLPKALMHPDPCTANLVTVDGEEGVLVDWTGAGRGPRVLAFANLIWSVTTLAAVDAAVAGYRGHSALDDQELHRIEASLVGFPLILDTWMFLFQGAPLSMVISRLTTHRERAAAVAKRVRSAFASPPPPPATKDAEEKQGSLF